MDAAVADPSLTHSIDTYRKVSFVALGSLITIVISGALVRLTGSGLGCTDWPRCNEQKLIDVSSAHAAIEQINRLFTGIVSVSVVATVLMAYRVRPRRTELVLWAWMLVVGVLAQIILGGIVVLTGLHPLANMGHFLLSMFLVFAAVVLLRRIDRIGSVSLWRHVRDLPEKVRSRHMYAFAVSAILTMILGTVVTASGPHAGDVDAPRLGFDLSTVARLHSVSMFATIACVLILLHRTRTSFESASRSHMQSALTVLISVIVIQGAVGYWQYFSGVPAFLVAIHIAGATAFFVASLNVLLAPNRTQ